MILKYIYYINDWICFSWNFYTLVALNKEARRVCQRNKSVNLLHTVGQNRFYSFNTTIVIKQILHQTPNEIIHLFPPQPGGSGLKG